MTQASKALKKLSKKPLTIDDVAPILKEVSTGSPRGSALIGGTMVENALHTLLVTRMMRLTSSEHEELFGIFKPLGSFSASISVGYAFRLFGPRTKHDLNLTREIRNTFAHTSHVIDFDTPAVSEATTLFNCLEGAEPKRTGTSRHRFAFAVQLLTYHLLGEVDQPRTRDTIASLD